MKTFIVDKNKRGGYFEHGKPFGEAKWTEIIASYQTEFDSAGKCSINCLVELTKIGYQSAVKAITFHCNGYSFAAMKSILRGVGSLKRFKMKHHVFIYALYLSNPSLPSYGYCVELEKCFVIKVSLSFMNRWYKSIGQFKGNYRKTSRFPPAKYSQKNTHLLKHFMAFAMLFDWSCFVFADKKPTNDNRYLRYSSVRHFER